MKLKIQRININDFEEGDFVLCYDNSDAYLIIGKSRTFLHRHIFYRVVYKDGTSKTLHISKLEENGKTREVFRC